MVDFSLTESQRAVGRTAREFAEREIACEAEDRGEPREPTAPRAFEPISTTRCPVPNP